MEPTPQELDAIARILADAAPDWGTRAAVAQAAGLQDAELTGHPLLAWAHLVRLAVEAERLDTLIAAAHLRVPSHGALAKLHEGVPVGQVDVGRIGWLAGAGLVVVVLLGLWVGLRWMEPQDGAEFAGAAPGTPLAPVQVPQRVAPVAVAEAPAADAIEAEVPDGHEAGGAPAAAKGTVGAATADQGAGDAPGDAGSREVPEAAEITTAPAVVQPPPPSTTTAPPAGDGPCAGTGGWVYLGSSTTATVGSSWVAPEWLNVRDDYPREANNFRMGGKVCVLPKGARVAVEQAPLAVPGGVWWMRVEGAWISR